MKPSQIASALAAVAIAANQPAFVWGPPGAGKSQVVQAVAKAYGEMIDLRLPLMDAVDLRGIPFAVVKDGTTKWFTPEMFPRDGKGVIFLDELVQASPVVQAAASQLILDRQIGEYKLPPGWRVIGAGNRDSDRASTNRMPSHIANRFCHFDFEVDPMDWYDWAYANQVNPMIIAYLQFKPDMLMKFDAKQKAFPSPRSWEAASKILNAGGVDDCLQEVVKGTVGDAAATEFTGFIRVFRDLPDYETIKKRPEGCKVPEGAEVKYAIASMLASLTQPADMQQVMKYVKRLPNEFQIVATQEMTKHNKKLAETSGYIAWAAANKDLLLNATVR